AGPARGIAPPEAPRPERASVPDARAAPATPAERTGTARASSDFAAPEESAQPRYQDDIWVLTDEAPGAGKSAPAPESPGGPGGGAPLRAALRPRGFPATVAPGRAQRAAGPVRSALCTRRGSSILARHRARGSPPLLSRCCGPPQRGRPRGDHRVGATRPRGAGVRGARSGAVAPAPRLLHRCRPVSGPPLTGPAQRLPGAPKPWRPRVAPPGTQVWCCFSFAGPPVPGAESTLGPRSAPFT